MDQYIGIAAAFLVAAVITGGMLFLASKLGKKKPSAVKSAPFECGMDPFSLPGGRLAIKFYLTAILFVLFDVEVVFLFPWAASFGVLSHEFGAFVLLEMAAFVGILVVGWLYAWRKGSLEWS